MGSSSDALYHVIPEVDANANVANTLQIELEGDRVEYIDPVSSPTNYPPSYVESQIRWVYFILGAAFLLPWNGTFILSQLFRRAHDIGPVVITAMPYFLGRLSTSPLRSTFSSYLTSSFTLSNFLFLAHATLISKRVGRVYFQPQSLY